MLDIHFESEGRGWTETEENFEINEKYGCDSCGKSFSDKNKMTRHIENTHDAIKSKKLDYNTHKCVYCGYSFTTSNFLKIHIQDHHKGPNHLFL